MLGTAFLELTVLVILIIDIVQSMLSIRFVVPFIANIFVVCDIQM